ncbi:hypothetical protein [Chlorobium sp. N1]|uniref:hypothetical protein n=1 Tax=Chlorobium sp. N1 TaxID=2491138 RepID=UPI001040C261|nr:hypothetical protein [Chlorobium sp. N1]TCD47475.1 hypothetical protein E0L29_08005 [Chlorobium sp. N1]
MKKNSVHPGGAAASRTGLKAFVSRIFISILHRLFPALRAAEFLAPRSVDVFSTSRQRLFTSPRMARAILQHRRPEACMAAGGQDRPADPLWDPFGYGYPQSLN